MNQISRCKRLVACAGCCASLLAVNGAAYAQSVANPPSASSLPQVKDAAQLPSPSSSPIVPAVTSSSVPATDGVFSDLFGDLVGDFRNLPSKNSATWLGIGAAAALVGHVGDGEVTHFMSAQGLHETFEGGQVMGGTAMQLGAALGTYAAGRISGSSRATAVGAELFRAQLITTSMTSLVKVAANRTRPDGTSYSFPSGHTAAAFATATVLERNFGWKVGIPAYAFASFVGASRIQTERHYLSDVAFGAALGILAGHTVTVGPKDARFAVAPFAVEGGGGVGFSLLPSSH